MICISRYNEDLSWTLDFPFNQFNYIVYNKGINDIFEKKHVVQVIDLPNLGRCDHTYLYHVVTNYKSLSDIVLFLPGSTDMIHKKFIATKLLTNVLRNKKASFIGGESSILHAFSHFTVEEYCCLNPINQALNNESKVYPCPQRPFGKWFVEHGFTNVPYYCFYGVFSIDKRDILQHPMERYQQLVDELSVHSNPEVGHYTERAWGSIFGPFQYTVVEKAPLPIYNVVEKKQRIKRKSMFSFMYKRMK